MEIQTIVSEFTERLTLAIEGKVADRARQAVLAAFNGANQQPPRRGRPPKASTLSAAIPRVDRKKPPRQLCPVPGCKNTAAPVFGMVCSQHKNVAKAKIRKYREARKAAKAA